MSDFTLDQIMDKQYWSREDIERMLKMTGINSWNSLIEKFEEKKNNFCFNNIECKKDISDEIILSLGPVLEPTLPIMEEIEIENWKSRMRKFLQNK